MKTNQIWEELEKDKSFSSGLLLRRYGGHVIPDIYVGLRLPERRRCIVVKYKNELSLNLRQYDNLKDILLTNMPDEKDSSRNVLLVLLANPMHHEVFSVLAEDLIQTVATLHEEKELIQELVNRFVMWQALFEKIRGEGLSTEKQIGLYGELFFLRQWILQSSDFVRCIHTWVGPSGADQDFYHESVAVEIKTAAGGNTGRIYISNERQLDLRGLSALFILHLELTPDKTSGETLNDIVSDICGLLRDNAMAHMQFQAKLYLAGYFSQHEAIYEGTGYTVRQDYFYEVKDDFPRIEPADLRLGVSKVSYTITPSDYPQFRIDQSAVFASMNMISQ